MKTTYFLDTDLRGSTRVVCDTNGNRSAWLGHDPFGAALESACGGDADLLVRLTRRYTGQVFEQESGLYHYGARLYDDALARFVSADPHHQTASPYAYCSNDPVDHVDPDGQDFIIVVHALANLTMVYHFDDQGRWLRTERFTITHFGQRTDPNALQLSHVTDRDDPNARLQIVQRRTLLALYSHLQQVAILDEWAAGMTYARSMTYWPRYRSYALRPYSLVALYIGDVAGRMEQPQMLYLPQEHLQAALQIGLSDTVEDASQVFQKVKDRLGAPKNYIDKFLELAYAVATRKAATGKNMPPRVETTTATTATTPTTTTTTTTASPTASKQSAPLSGEDDHEAEKQRLVRRDDRDPPPGGGTREKLTYYGDYRYVDVGGE